MNHAEEIERAVREQRTGSIGPERPDPFTRRALLDRAAVLVEESRAQEHGDARGNFSLIAGYWSAHLGCDVTATDVAVMMALLKIARLRKKPRNAENWIDGAGYLALGGEIAQAR